MQRDPSKAKPALPVPLESVEAIGTRLAARQSNLNQHLVTSKEDIGSIRSYFGSVNGVYKRSHDHHAMVVAQAKAQAETKQQWVDFAVGVGTGIAVGLMSEALIAGKLAEAAYETVAEVGAELVEGGIARAFKPEVPKVELLPELAPEFKQIRSLQTLDDLNVAVLQLAAPGTFTFTDPMVQTERLSAELRLISAGADADHRRMSDDDIRSKFDKLKKFDAASANSNTQLETARAAFAKLRSALASAPPLTDAQVEQDIWIPWIMAQDIDTFFAPTIFSALMRNHFADIGLTGRLGVIPLGNQDSLFGQFWPNNPTTEQEHRVVNSYKDFKDAAGREGKLLAAFWNKVFLQ